MVDRADNMHIWFGIFFVLENELCTLKDRAQWNFHFMFIDLTFSLI
jgi:hypothetical protein